MPLKPHSRANPLPLAIECGHAPINAHTTPDKHVHGAQISSLLGCPCSPVLSEEMLASWVHAFRARLCNTRCEGPATESAPVSMIMQGSAAG